MVCNHVMYNGLPYSLACLAPPLHVCISSSTPTECQPVLAANCLPACLLPPPFYPVPPPACLGVCRCDPQASERTLCVLLRHTLQYRLLVAGHDAGGGVLTRQQVQKLVPQAGAQLPMLPGLPGLNCTQYEGASPKGGTQTEGEPVSSEL